MEVVVERLALPQKFRREDEVDGAVLFAQGIRIADRDGGLDDHQRLRVDLEHDVDDIFDSARIEKVQFFIVVGGCRNDDDFGVAIGALLVQCRAQIELFCGQVFLNFLIL